MAVNDRVFNLRMIQAGKPVVIYGAQAVAYTVYKAIMKLTSCSIKCFLVSKAEGQPREIDGIKVFEFSSYVYCPDDLILIATPEDIQWQIAYILDKTGYENYAYITSEVFGNLQKEYYSSLKIFPSIDKKEYSVAVYQAVHEKDKKLNGEYQNREWIIPIQVGASKASQSICKVSDDAGDNISDRNCNYSELTAMYWAWKNSDAMVKGICHYRRVPDLSDADIISLVTGQTDAILIYPMMYYPDITEHHKRYLSQQEWEIVEAAICKIAPDYREAAHMCMTQQYFFNYNILVARKDVFDLYCAWLFPILFEIGKSTGEDKRKDRYIGYIGENLFTIFFWTNKEKLHISYCGCLLRT